MCTYTDVKYTNRCLYIWSQVESDDPEQSQLASESNLVSYVDAWLSRSILFQCMSDSCIHIHITEPAVPRLIPWSAEELRLYDAEDNTFDRRSRKELRDAEPKPGLSVICVYLIQGSGFWVPRPPNGMGGYVQAPKR